MINVLYVDKKNIEFIGFLFRTFRIFSKIRQHETISLHPSFAPVSAPSPLPFSGYGMYRVPKSTVCRSNN